MLQPAVDYLAIGHVAYDLLPGTAPDAPASARLGGTVAYAALTAQALDYRPGIVTACAPGLDLADLDAVARHCVPSDANTTFENIYAAGERTQYLRAQAEALRLEHIPAEWLRARIIHLAPLAQEMAAGLAGDLAAAAPGAFIGLTPQGWLRQWAADGQVSLSVGAWPQAGEVLGQVSAAVISVLDVNNDWAVAEQWAKALPVLAVTEGAAGCTVFTRDRGARQFRAPRVEEVDPTGAGDIFAAAFFVHLYETGDAWGAARLANEIAALSVGRAGLAGVPAREEVGYCRARAEQQQEPRP